MSRLFSRFQQERLIRVQKQEVHRLDLRALRVILNEPDQLLRTVPCSTLRTSDAT